MAALHLRGLAVAVLCCAAPLAHAAERQPCTQPIDVKSDGASEFDFRTGKTIMHHVSISQCDVSVTADRAEATNLDSKDSRWVFSGNVHITAERSGSMQSDQADVEFRDNRIAKATIRGEPAQFEQKRTTSQDTARGRAREIVYEVGPGTVRFTDDAWLSYGANELSGPLCVYNIMQETARCERGARITIVPKLRTDPATPPTSTKKAADEHK